MNAETHEEIKFTPTHIPKSVTGQIKNASTLRVAFQGERGAFSEEAALQLLGAEVELVPCVTFDKLFAAIDEGKADVLLAPFENSLAGAVVRCQELWGASQLGIIGEIVLPIAQHLIGCRDAKFENVRVIMSHAVALAQCEKFFAAHPQIERVIADDTAGSVRQVMAEGDRTRAAIAGEYAAQLYGGKILRANVHDTIENYTRFVLLAPYRKSEV